MNMIFAKTENNRIRDSLIQLRESALHKIAWISGTCSWLLLTWSLWPLSDQAVFRYQMRPVSLFLMIVTIISFMLIEREIMLAAIIHVSGTVISIMSVVGILQAIDMIHLFAIPIIFASVLLGQRAVMITTLVVMTFNLAVAPVWLELHWLHLITPTLILMLIAAAVIISTRNLYTALWWALDGFETARHNQNIARERKAELEQALKSLDVAAYNLRRMNYALSLAQKRAEEARQLKQQFAQTISHELRTPLNLIVGFSETMIQSPEYYGQPLPSPYLRDMSIVYRNANHLQNLVNDVLDLARIEAAQMTLQIEHHVLHVFLDEIVSMAQTMAETSGLTFCADIETLLPDVWLDSIRIKQVLYNLVSNAVRFTETGGITLRISQQGQDILFEVIDTGIGIAAADMSRIFEPFCQLENPMRRRIGGAGLGLPISRQLVTLHGGELGVESEPGKGSRFYFHIPIKPDRIFDAGLETPTAMRPLEIQDENLLLVVTRNHSAASLFSRHLQRCRTVVVENIERACMAMRQLVPQAVLIDASMIQIEIEQLATSPDFSQTLVIVCPFPGETILQQHLSVDDYLIKPVSRESLWGSLRQFDASIERILVVDDDPDFVRMIERMLDTPLKHYQIDRAYNGREALIMMNQHRPDLLLLDLHMPNSDGFEVITQVHESALWHDIPIVVVSAQDEIDMSHILDGNMLVTRFSGIKPLELVRWVQGLLMF